MNNFIVSFFKKAQIFFLLNAVFFIYLQMILLIMLFKFPIFLAFGKATEHNVN